MNFVDQFWQMVWQYPERTAIVDRGGTRRTTYRELSEMSGRIAAKLGREGDMTGKAVVVCMDRRMEYVAAEIGILMAGAAFVPVLPEYPGERRDYIREDCQAVTEINVDWLADVEEHKPVQPVSAADSDRALIIYTSGSTGRPKGIVHSMASFTQGIWRIRKAMCLDEHDRIAATAPMSFVAILMEYFTGLSEGSCVHILPEEVRKDVRLMEDYFAREEITFSFISPQMLRLYKNKDKALKTVVTGSERVSRLAGDGYELYNTYGCSETALLVAYYKIEEPAENTPIGKPADGLEIFLLDDEGNEVPEGEEGELCVKGILASAYLNLEEQSAQTFQIQEDGKVLVHTRDMAKKLPDGNYIYVNRKDWMVKINGQRVETGEIELRLQAAAGVRNAVVKAFEDENGQSYLCAYHVSEPEVDEKQLRAYLKEYLPDYMIPRFFQQLESLPKNVNGKLDRSQLMPPGLDAYKAAYTEPENDVQRRICAGFGQVLHCGRVGLDDDFFKLGGDSINVLKLAGQLSDIALTPEVVLKGRTPREIARLLEGQNAQGPRKLEDAREEYPLTDSQMGVYLECAADPGSTMYNIPMCCELPADIDRNRFVEAVKRAVAMHPSFGVNIALRQGMPAMYLRPEFLNAEVAEWETEDIQAVKKTFVRPFSMEGEPLYRMELYQGRDHVYFLFDVHHIIFDGTSVKVFLDEISAFYQGEEPKQERISLMDQSVYEETLRDMPQYQAAQRYFQEKLAGEDFGESLIRDYKKKEVSARSGKVSMSLGEEMSCMSVEQFARQKGISENTLFLGAFSYALGKYSGGSKSLFCTVNNGRHTVDLAESTGMFVRTLPIYHSWDEDSPVETYLQSFQEEFYEVMSHDCISFAELAREYGVASDILFVYQGEMLSGLTLEGRRYAAEPLFTGEVQADLSVMVMKHQEGYEVSLEYRRDLYAEQTMRGLLGMLQQVLKGMLSRERLAQIALTSNLDLQILDHFNETSVSYDRDSTIVDLFRAGKAHTGSQGGDLCGQDLYLCTGG